ncbi:oligosaccharide flippase family protein [Bisgaard Taxon 45]
MINKTFFFNVIWSMGSHILSRGMLLLSGMLLARNLPVDDFATYNFFIMTATIISNYSSMGLGVSSSRFFAEKKENQNTLILGNLYSISLILAIISSTLTFLFIDKVWSIETYYKWLISVTVFFLILNIVPTGGVMGVEKYKDLFFLSIFNTFIMLIGVFITIRTNNISIQIYAYILSIVFLISAQSYILKEETDLFRKVENFIIRKNAIKEIISFGGVMSLVSILAATAPWLLGKIILDKYSSLYFSVYSIGLQWFSLAMFIPGIVSRLILPRLVKQYKVDNQSKKEVRLTLLVTLSVSLLFLIIGTILSPHIMNWYGKEYTDFHEVIILFFIISVIYTPINVLGNIIIIKVNTRSWLFITSIWFVFILSSVYPLMSYFGFLGALYAQGIAAILLNIISYHFCRKKELI